jgi:hypothetical protein
LGSSIPHFNLTEVDWLSAGAGVVWFGPGVVVGTGVVVVVGAGVDVVVRFALM